MTVSEQYTMTAVSTGILDIGMIWRNLTHKESG